MSRKRIGNPKVAKIAIFASFSLALLFTAQFAFGDAVGGSSIMVSPGPCLFSVQLQKSVSLRRNYLVQLSAVLGDTVSSAGSIEEMYGNILPASYDASSRNDLLGLGSGTRPEDPELDQFSSNCITCHDGAGAVQVSVDWRNNPSGATSLQRPHGTDHPIGMDYESYVASRRGDYKSVSGLNTKMLFVNGRVGCLTCHDPLNPERGHLVMSDRNSALCLTCHGK